MSEVTHRQPNYSFFDYNENDQILNNTYIKIQDLNKGSYGNITLARNIKKEELVAIKYFYTVNNDEDDDNPKGDVNNCLYEYNILKTLNNNISNKDIGFNYSDLIITAKDQFDAYLVMDFCSHGDLYDAIRNETIPKSSKMLFHIINQVTKSISFIHLNGVYHRDIKPENILIYDITKWHIKLTDFGLATVDMISNEKDLGSERYMAPELFYYEKNEANNLDFDDDELFSNENNSKPYDSSKVDIWALGITILNIVFHKNPFEIAKPNLDTLFNYYCYSKEAILDIFDTMTPDFYNLVVSCLNLNPEKRNFAGIFDLLNKCKLFTFDDTIYNKSEYDLYKDIYVEDWVDNTMISPPQSPIQTKNFEPIDINTKHYETTGDVFLRLQKEGNVVNSWKAKNLNKLKKFKRNYPNQKYQYNNKKDNYKNKKDGYAKTNDTFFKNYNSRKPLGIPKPNKHILKYNNNKKNNKYKYNNGISPNLHNASEGKYSGFSHKPLSFKSTHNSFTNSQPNSFVTKNGIKNTHYNKNFNYYMDRKSNGSYNDVSDKEEESEEENISKVNSQEDYNDIFDYEEEVEEEKNGKFQTAHEFIKVQDSLKNLQAHKKNFFKKNYHDEDHLFTLEENNTDQDNSQDTINEELPIIKKKNAGYLTSDDVFKPLTNVSTKKTYMSPANRRNSASQPQQNYYNGRRKSHSAGTYLDPNTDLFQLKKFNRPSFINSLTSKPTLSFNSRHIDVFSDEDEENDVHFAKRHPRKSVNEEIVSMEDYKNNWLSMQLDDE